MAVAAGNQLFAGAAELSQIRMGQSIAVYIEETGEMSRLAQKM